MRQLRVLVQHLPTTGALARAVRGHGWSDAEYLLANIIDAVQFSAYSVVGSLGGKPKKPKPMERPDETRKHRTGDRGGHSTPDVVTYLDSLRPEKAG